MASKTLLLLLTGLFCVSCDRWTLNHPADPLHCSEVCAPGSRCIAGRCTALDAGGLIDGGGQRWAAKVGAKAIDDVAQLVTCDPGGVVVSGQTGKDAFVVAYRGDGTQRWLKSYDSRDTVAVRALAIDSTRSRVIAGGEFNLETAFDSQTLRSSGYSDAVLLGLDLATGEIGAIRQYGGTSWESIWEIVLIDDTLWVAGAFKSSLDVGGPLLTSRGNDDIWVATLDPASWKHRSSRSIGTTGRDSMFAMIADPAAVDGVILAGGHGADLVLKKTLRKSLGKRDALVLALDAEQRERWSGTLGSSGEDYFHGLATAGDSIYVAGRMAGSIAIPGGALPFGGGGSDALIASFATDGRLRWTLAFGEVSGDEALAVAADEQGAVVVGYFAGSVDIRGHKLTADETDAFVLRLDPQGRVRWIKQIGGSGHQAARGAAICDGAVYVVGDFEGTLEGSAEVSSGKRDAFVMRVEP